MKKIKTYQNCLVLLMGFAGTGKLTIAKELAKHDNFKLIDNHSILNPVLNIVNQDGITPLPETVWINANKIWDVVFNTLTVLSPTYFSFVITQEMIEGDEFPKQFYHRINQLVAHRNSIFLPVRLLCTEQELIKRVKSTERQKLYKTIDADRASRLAIHHDVFHTHHANEITIDVTLKKPKDVVTLILNKLGNLLGSHHVTYK